MHVSSDLGRRASRSTAYGGEGNASGNRRLLLVQSSQLSAVLLTGSDCSILRSPS